MTLKLDVEFCGVSLNNWLLIYIHGQKQMVTLILFVQFMNFTVVSAEPFSFKYNRYRFNKNQDTSSLSHTNNIAGEDINGMSFEGADEELLRRALAILEQQGKCAIFKGENSEEDGIKFFK